MWKYLLGILAFLLFAGTAWYVWFVDRIVREPIALGDIIPPLPTDPMNATFNIEGKEVALVDGRLERESVPGSSSRDIYAMWGEPVVTDVNADGTDDALVWLTYNGGGSGTFFYIAAAVRDGDGFRGSVAVPLGDRIAPQAIDLWHEVVRVSYASHAEGQSMGEPPTEAVTRYFMVQGAEFVELGPFGAGTLLLPGELVWGGDSVTFSSCEGVSYAISPDSRARAALKAIYLARLGDRAEGEPVFVVVAGEVDVAAQVAQGLQLTVEAVLSAPRDGACDVGTVSTSSNATTTSSTSAAL